MTSPVMQRLAFGKLLATTWVHANNPWTHVAMEHFASAQLELPIRGPIASSAATQAYKSFFGFYLCAIGQQS